jgi:hypothetical protein
MPFLHCARDIVIDDLARHPETASEDEAGYRSYELRLGSKKTLYEALRQTHELEAVKRIVGYSSGPQEVTGHCGGVGRLRNGRRDSKTQHLENIMMVVLLDWFVSY